MTQKKFFQIAAITVSFVWVFCITFAVAYTVRSKAINNPAIVDPSAIVTNAPITIPTTTLPPSQLTTTAPVQFPSVTSPVATPTNPVATTQPTTLQSNCPRDKSEIVNAYINGVNLLKSTPNFSLQKNDTLNVTITDVQMSGGEALRGAVMEVANDIIKPPVPESYNFINGVDAATGKTPTSTIAPLNLPAQVDVNAVTEAQAQPNADGGYTLMLVLQPETQTMHSPAPNLSTMVQVIDVNSLLPSGATLTDVNINYAPSTILAVFDNQNRIVSMEHKLTSQGYGSGKLIISVKMVMEGTYSSNYTVTYN